METNPVTQQTEETTEEISIRDILISCASHWRWYVATVVVALAVAVLYIKKTQPVYKRDASIMVLERNDKPTVLNQLLNDYVDFGFFADNTNVNNVIAAIKSPDVMSEVVDRLGLDVSYTTRGTFYDKTLYGKTLPVKVVFRDIPKDETASLHIRLKKDGSIKMSEFVKNGKPQNSYDLTCHVGQTVNTPLGRLTIERQPHYPSAVADNDEIDVRKSDNASATGRFLGGLSVEIGDKKSTILDLSYNDVSGKRAEDILSAVIDIYNKVWMKNRNEVSAGATKFLDERLAIIERELDNVDNDISRYKSKNLLPDVEKAYSLSMERADKNSAILLDLNTKLSVAGYIRDYITNRANTNQLLPANMGLDDGKTDGLIDKYNALQLERNSLMANGGKNNPLVKDIDKALNQLRRSVISSINNMIVSLSTRIGHIQNDEQKTNTDISTNPTQAKELLAVERQQKVKEALYLFLLQKREENQLSQSFTADNTQIVKSPTGSNVPLKPKKGMIMLIALVIGLALPTGVIYLMETTNNKVRGRKDIEDNLTAPFVGEIPLVEEERKGLSALKPAQEKAYGIVVEHGNHNLINEAFRIVRTNIEFLTPQGNGASVQMLTSYNSGSGKTFLAMNIATSLAIKDKRVLVIDGDLRTAGLSRYIGNPKLGLSNYLGRHTDDIDSIICHYETCTGLDIMPSGVVPPNPAELLASDRLPRLLAEMKKRYDYIFVDCPPIDAVADTSIISHYAERTLFVVRAGKLERAMLADLEKLYKSGRLNNLSVILNGTRNAGTPYAYRYGYSYGYGTNPKSNSLIDYFRR
ncbi:capsular exopolysaccharide family [Prevotella sp. CAG:1124]|nr:capsular exopolysaccharide family [Prevotella sp. CAG:1124]